MNRCWTKIDYLYIVGIILYNENSHKQHKDNNNTLLSEARLGGIYMKNSAQFWSA